MDSYASTPSFSTPSPSTPSTSTSTCTTSTPYSQDSLESLNLTKIFNQEPTDLDDEDEKPASDMTFSTPSFSTPSPSTSFTSISTSSPSTTYPQDSVKSLDLTKIFNQEPTDLDDEDEKPASDTTFSTPSPPTPYTSTSTFTPSTSTSSTINPQDSVKSLDLTKAFNQEATDLDDEDENPVSDITNTTTSEIAVVNRYFPDMGSFVPEDIADQKNDFYNNMSPEDQQKPCAWDFAEACVKWEYMVEASKEIRRLTDYKPPQLEPADRSLDWFWENGRPLDNEDSPSDPVESDEVEPPFHHLNYLGHPMSQKSSTPASESLWLAFTSHKSYYHSFSRQGVINSQATKWIDPFVYSPPQDKNPNESKDILRYSGTALKNAVEGHVVKVYDDEGTWVVEDGVASSSDWEERFIFRYKAPEGNLQAPHWVSPDDDEDIIVNDDGKGCYFKSKASEYTPSKLRYVEFADEPSPVSGSLVSNPPSLSPSSESVAEVVVEEVKIVEEVLKEEDEEKADTAPGPDGTDSNPVPPPSEVTATSPSSPPTPEYLEVFAACNGITKLAAEKAAAWEDVKAGLSALAPFLGRKFDFQATSEEDVEEEVEEDVSDSEQEAIEVRSGDAEIGYGPIALAVGHTAYRLAGWASKYLW